MSAPFADISKADNLPSSVVTNNNLGTNGDRTQDMKRFSIIIATLGMQKSYHCNMFFFNVALVDAIQTQNDIMFVRVCDIVCALEQS